MKLKVLDLFSGIGGFSLGLDRSGGFETVGFCEIEEFPTRVLNKNFPGVPVFSDIRKLNKELLNDSGITNIDVICGGFPCQPFSNAGKKKGREDDRDLWPEMFRVIKEAKPTWVIGENVAGFIGMEFTRTKTDLESVGYRVQPFIIPACAVGAQHRRDRVWIIAHLDRSKLRKQPDELTECNGQGLAGYNGQEEPLADISSKCRLGMLTEIDRAQAGNQACTKAQAGHDQPNANINSNGLGRETNAASKKNTKRNRKNNRWPETSTYFGNWWTDQSGMGRTVHGFSTRVDRFRKNRVKALGNAVVPAIVEIIGKAIIESEKES